MKLVNKQQNKVLKITLVWFDNSFLEDILEFQIFTNLGRSIIKLNYFLTYKCNYLKNILVEENSGKVLALG